MHVEVAREHGEPSTDDLRELLGDLTCFDRVILASQNIEEGLVADLIAVCRRERIKLTVVPAGGGLFGAAGHVSHVADLPLIEYHTSDVSRSTVLIKRCFDVIVSAALLLAVCPLFVIIAIAIKLDDGGPVFFSQTRAGRANRPFRMFKFPNDGLDGKPSFPTWSRSTCCPLRCSSSKEIPG